MAGPLYIVFALHDNDILNCRMATYDLSKAEAECLVVLRTTIEKNCWCRILSFPCTFKTGTQIWVSLEDQDDFTDIRVISVDNDEELIPQGADWTDSQMIV